MSARSAADLIEEYVTLLKAELDAVGAAGTDDLAAEVRSMLVEAAGDDAERAADEIARLGSAADLAAGILAERGLSPEGGMTPAEWWRMGIAVPIDILVGASVPVAVLALLILVVAIAPAPIVLLGVGALFIGSLGWAWYVWRPWRVGGVATSAGMAIARIAVVRAPGFWRVVRAEDLERLGLSRPGRRLVAAIVPLLFALFFVGWAAVAGAGFLEGPTLDRTAEALAGSEGGQRDSAGVVVRELYRSLAASDTVSAGMLVAAGAGGADGAALRSLQERLAGDALRKVDIVSADPAAPRIWTFQVVTTGRSGTRYTDTLTVSMSLVTRTNGYEPRWIVTDINGASGTCGPSG